MTTEQIEQIRRQQQAKFPYPRMLTEQEYQEMVADFQQTAPMMREYFKHSPRLQQLKAQKAQAL